MTSSAPAPDPRSPVRNRRARAGVVVFLVAACFRLVVFSQLQNAPLFRTPQLDSLEYLEWATQIARGDFSWPVAPIHGPGYPYFLGFVLALSGSQIAIGVVQSILAGLSALFVMGIAMRLHGPIAGIAAGLLHATYAPLMLIEVSIIAESLFVFLLALAMWLTLRIFRNEFERPLPVVLTTGLVLGLAIVVRPTAAALVPLFAFFAIRSLSDRRGLAAFLLIVAIAAPVVPVVMLNRTTAPDVVAVQTSGAMNFYIGNSPKHDGTAWARPGGKWDLLRGAAYRSGARGPAAEDRFYLQAAAREIAADPIGFARLLGSKLLWLVQNEEVRDSHSFHFFAESSPLLRWFPRFGVVFALAVAGLALALRRPRPPGAGLAAGYALIIALTVVALVIGFRYRMPILPALFVFAGAALSMAIDRVAARRWNDVAILTVAFAAGLAGSHLREHPASHDFSEELTMTALALKNEGNLPAAAEAARRATIVNPRYDAAWVAAGDIHATRGQWEQAEAAWRQALQADGNNARAWSHLGLAQIRRGDMRAGEESLLRALSIRPDEEAAYNMGILRRSAR